MTVNQFNEEMRILCLRKAAVEKAKDSLVDALYDLEGEPTGHECLDLINMAKSTPKYKRLEQVYFEETEKFRNKMLEAGYSISVADIVVEAIDSHYYLMKRD